jgi:hypothetical protein
MAEYNNCDLFIGGRVGPLFIDDRCQAHCATPVSQRRISASGKKTTSILAVAETLESFQLYVVGWLVGLLEYDFKSSRDALGFGVPGFKWRICGSC